MMKAALLLLLVMCLSSCATNPAPDAAGPRATDAPYPILLSDDEGTRHANALAAWTNLTRSMGITNASAPELQPVTATVRSLPAMEAMPLYLPKVGEALPMNEEETRESLRRFIVETGPLLCGGELQQLSLVQRVDGANGVKEARYQQRPFRYGLRGGYGVLSISFTPDRRIVQMTSTCVPDIERLRRSFIALAQQRMTSDKTIEGIAGRAVAYTDASGTQQTLTLPEKEQINARELVIYPIARGGEPPVLEFHVAWELFTTADPGLSIYLDSVTGDVLGAERKTSA
jgi:hypothetical protein